MATRHISTLISSGAKKCSTLCTHVKQQLSRPYKSEFQALAHCCKLNLMLAHTGVETHGTHGRTNITHSAVIKRKSYSGVCFDFERPEGHQRTPLVLSAHFACVRGSFFSAGAEMSIHPTFATARPVCFFRASTTPIAI